MSVWMVMDPQSYSLVCTVEAWVLCSPSPLLPFRNCLLRKVGKVLSSVVEVSRQVIHHGQDTVLQGYHRKLV